VGSAQKIIAKTAQNNYIKNKLCAKMEIMGVEKLNSPTVSALGVQLRKLSNVRKGHWVTKNISY
jgi:hypothetical protein